MFFNNVYSFSFVVFQCIEFNLNLPFALVRVVSIELNRIAAPVQLFFINPTLLILVRNIFIDIFQLILIVK